MDREATKIHPVAKALALQALEIIIGFVGHLSVQNLHGVEAHLGGQVEASLDTSQVLLSKLPKGISGHGNAVASVAGAFLALASFGARFLSSNSRSDRGPQPE